MAQSIRDIMTRDVQTVSPDTTVKDAAGMMKARNIGSLPVTEGKKVVGLITDRDITIRVVAEGRDPGSSRIGDVMSMDVVTVREDADLKEAECLMHDRQLRRLPIVNAQGELAGYLALAKIARTETLQEAGKVIKGVSHPSTPAPMESDRRRRRQKTG
jgi:CBS domain-containing protein